MDTSRLKREVHQMPDDVERILEDEKLSDLYRKRPPYQQNDYIGWINKAKMNATRENRIKQMVE